MEKIIGLLTSSSTSLSSIVPDHSIQESVVTAEATISGPLDPHSTMSPGISKLEALPAEIIGYILAFLPPVSLASLSQTCALLRSHAHNDLLWLPFVRSNVHCPGGLESPSPAKSWRDLFIAHHPYWFLVQNKIWFADTHNNGLLILARYNSQNGCIEAFRLLAEHGAHKYETWAHNPEVIIHTFNPRVRLWLDDPVIKLGLDTGSHHDGNRLQKEVSMQTGTRHGICSMISLCRPIPRVLQSSAMYVHFRDYPSCLVLNQRRKACFVSRKTFLLPMHVLQLHFLPRVSDADSEMCVGPFGHLPSFPQKTEYAMNLRPSFGQKNIGLRRWIS